MAIADKDLFENANKYRLHQDTLRWTLLAGYAAFLVGLLSIEKSRLPDALRIVLVAVGICYMVILAVENFFYNLFAEYVKDCESRRDSEQKLRTLREFSAAEAGRVGPFHLSFVFALMIVLLGNIALTLDVASCVTRIILFAVSPLFFVLTLLLWRVFVFRYLVLPFQRIFDVSDEQRNVFWRLLRRIRSRKKRPAK